MTTAPRSEARRAGWMILGLLAIPFLSVTGVALLADIASTTDPGSAAVGVPALLGGVVTAALVVRLARAVHSGTVALRAALLHAFDHGRVLSVATARPIVPSALLAPALLVVPAPVGRRGPPRSS